MTATARASDGDSLHLGGDRVRLLGLDAPELAQMCRDEKGADWPCGRAARDAMAALLRQGQLTCHPEGRDRFERMLAHCSVAGADIGARLVADGWAVATDNYHGEEQAARRARKGIWRGGFELPRDWRREEERRRQDPNPLRDFLRFLGG